MAVSIGWLLQQRQLGLTLRVAPADPARPLEFVQATELRDPTPWLSGGELVLTTGLDLGDDLAAYVHRLKAADVGGLAFGVGLSHDAVPALFIEAAERFGLTVLEVPYATPFAAVTRSVMARLAEQEYEQVLRAASAQTKITRAALRDGVDGVVRELSIATGHPVAFVTERAGSVFPADRGEVLTDARSAISAVPAIKRPASISTSSPDGAMTLQPVALASSHHGYLAIASTSALDAITQVLVGHAVSLITLELEKPQHVRMATRRLHAMAVGLLLDGRLTSDVPRYLMDAADETGQARVLVIHFPLTSALVDSIDALLLVRGRSLFAQSSTGEVVVVLRGDDCVDAVRELLDEAGDGDRRIRAGLSRIRPLHQAPEALRQARIAVSLATAGSRVMEYDASTGATLITSQQARGALETVADATYPILERHDRENGENLVGSLRTYLESNGQWESAASRLGVHRHTLRGRIRKIEKLLDCDLDRAHVRAELLLASLTLPFDGQRSTSES